MKNVRGVLKIKIDGGIRNEMHSYLFGLEKLSQLEETGQQFWIFQYIYQVINLCYGFQLLS